MAVRAAGEVKPFLWTAAASGDTLELTATVAPGHYFYANETFEIAISGKDGRRLSPNPFRNRSIPMTSSWGR